MEGLIEFLDAVDNLNHNYNYGYSCYDGSGCGFNCSPGIPDYGLGSGYGCDSGNISGDSYGSGYGYGYGEVDGSGDGSGYSNNIDIIMFNEEKIYWIDGVPTIIKNIKKQIAKGFILNEDLTLQPCYVAKIDNCYAHGDTIKEAVQQAREKTFELLPMDDRIKKFWDCHNLMDKYSARDLYEWHHILTGSCKMGRDKFIQNKNIDINNDMFTVDEFIEICKNDYGGNIINKLTLKA